MACPERFLSLEAALYLPHLEHLERRYAFVVGPFKSGTSMLTASLEKHGFFNPASTQTRIERAYGRRVRRYPTRECGVVRSINEHLLSSSSGRPIPDRILLAVPSQLFLDVTTFLDSLPDLTVIKDPLFCSTLLIWTRAAKVVGVTPFVFFVLRSRPTLLASWRYAPFTRFLLRECPDLPDRMAANMVLMLRSLAESRIPICITDYVQLTNLAVHPGISVGGYNV